MFRSGPLQVARVHGAHKARKQLTGERPGLCATWWSGRDCNSRGRDTPRMQVSGRDCNSRGRGYLLFCYIFSVSCRPNFPPAAGVCAPLLLGGWISEACRKISRRRSHSEGANGCPLPEDKSSPERSSPEKSPRSSRERSRPNKYGSWASPKRATGGGGIHIPIVSS